MSHIKTHVKKDDFVKVITGADRGKVGKVLQVLPEKGRVIVEGVRITTKATRKSNDRPEGGLVKREGPIHISNVKLTDEKPKKEHKEKQPAEEKKLEPKIKKTKAEAGEEKPKAKRAPAKKKSAE